MIHFKNIASLALMAAFILVIACIYVGQEQSIYHWDYAGYWRLWERFTTAFGQNPAAALDGVRHSIRGDDYNSLPAALIGISGILPLPSRLSFIIGIALVYFLPAVLLFSALSRTYSTDTSFAAKAVSVIIPLTLPAFWIPALRGYPDICGLIFIMLAVLYCSKHNFSAKIDVKAALLLGLILWAPFLLRRWYAYTILSLYILLPLLNYFLHNHRLELQKIKNIFVNFFIAGITSLILVLMFQWLLVWKIIAIDYATIYSAYARPLIYSIRFTADEAGPYMLFLAALALILTAFSRNRARILFVIFCLAMLALSFFLFTRTQGPGRQHIMPFIMWIALIITQGWLTFFEKIQRHAAKLLLLLVISAASLFILLHSLFGIYAPSTINAMLPPKQLPLHLENFPNYVKLAEDLEKRTQNGGTIAVFSSDSGSLLDEMLDSIAQGKLRNRIIYTAQVDLRDGLNISALSADYFIVLDPISLHLPEAGQQVIARPARALLENRNIGKAFHRVSEGYRLDKGFTAYIYQKYRPFTGDEVKEFLAEFYPSYPDWQQKYGSGLPFALLTAHIEKGDIAGYFEVDSSNNTTIYAHPGVNSPTKVTWTITGLRSLRLKSLDTGCNLSDTIIAQISGANIPEKQVEIAKGKSVVLDISQWQDKVSVLTIAKNKSPDCDSLSITGLQ